MEGRFNIGDTVVRTPQGRVLRVVGTTCAFGCEYVVRDEDGFFFFVTEDSIAPANPEYKCRHQRPCARKS